MVLMRGLINDVTLDDWLRKYIFPAEARNVTEDYALGHQAGHGRDDSRRHHDVWDRYYFEDAVARKPKPPDCEVSWAKRGLIPCPDNKNEAEMAAYSEKFLRSGKAIR